MRLHMDKGRVTGTRDKMIYGHFIEHFHRQIYGGVYDPDNPLSDEAGLRTDVMEAMRRIQVPVLRWPGGCFVSSYHWKDAVGEKRTPLFDKAWRVEDPNTFGTDEYIDMCRKIGCEPYICTNAGTGTPEEMSDWVEYCNLPYEGRYAKWRIENGYEAPHKVKYWSIGNENYGSWEIGAKSAEEWARLVKESAKMIKHVDPQTELTAAALTDLHWNIGLLESCGDFLDWISIHEYWDGIHQTNDYATYEQVVAYTDHIGHSIDEVRGLLTAMKLEKKIKIAFDEWNLRGWYHPNVHTIRQGVTKEEYLYPRDKNDDNTKYTMADAVFTACFLNEMNRNCDIVGMANFAPIVNTRGCIFTYPEGIVLRSTYYVFDLYVNLLGDVVHDCWAEEVPVGSVTAKSGERVDVELIDAIVTSFSDKAGCAVAAVNKDGEKNRSICLDVEAEGSVRIHTLNGDSTEAYNDIDHRGVSVVQTELGIFERGMEVVLPPHSVSVIEIGVS
ncbi:MAG: alpha-L-arabinofuranosidase C-terminal domain-containing protein [Lachnospiraceae bacterium]|nr:alpha-L-arabinofuranosidase C-terminal domain-containing protein [Lachnospiraceae bacterium]